MLVFKPTYDIAALSKYRAEIANRVLDKLVQVAISEIENETIEVPLIKEEEK